VSGVVPDAVGLAYPVAVDQIRGDEIRESDARRVANGEWCIAQRPADRPPHIDDLEAMAKQFFGFLTHQVTDPLLVALRLGEAGARVLVHGRDAERGIRIVADIEKAGGAATFFRADLASLAEVRRLAAAVREETNASRSNRSCRT